MSLGFSDTTFLFFLALLLFGPKKLPEIGRQIGKFMNEFRRASNEFRSQIESEIATLERQGETTPQILPPTRAPQGAVASGTLVDAPDPAPAAVPELTSGSEASSSASVSSSPASAELPSPDLAEPAASSSSPAATASSESSESNASGPERSNGSGQTSVAAVSETPTSGSESEASSLAKAPHV